VLPRAKITPEIAATRDIGRDSDCVSPAAHSAFSTPKEMLAFIVRLRELSGGKPVGIKMAVGHRFEALAIVKAMLETNITPDFITIDGGEGGTGAAPAELSNHAGMPLSEGLSFMQNALVGAGLRDRLKLGASGKLVSGYDFARVFAIGADYAMAARTFMFAVGCIQSRSCHTNGCPTGVATQDPSRQRALVVEDKAPRVANFHRNTLRALAELLGAAGVSHPDELKPWHLQIRHQNGTVMRADQIYPHVSPGAILRDEMSDDLRHEWRRAQADSFEPAL
jgi:glutamate synthase domain-containing protein 2